jgi:hypothetical protein
MPRQNNIQFRKGTYNQWDAQSSTVLGSGEPGFVTDFNKLKIGDGSTQWSDLSAINDALTTLVYNGTASTIPKMSVVYINGAQGDMPSIRLSIASGEMTSSKTYGITTNTISAGGTGMVVVDGALKNLNTSPAFDGATPGTTLWLSPTVSGGITTIKPSAPNHMVSVGNLIRIHNQQGIINVKVQNGFELEELHNVALSGVSGGQFLYYNSSSGLWQPNSTIYGSGNNIGIGTASPSTSLHVVGSGIVSGDMTIGGNLIVNGTTTTVNVDTVTIEDPIITLGLSSGNVVPNLTHDRGLALVRGTGLTAFMGWDTSASQFVMLSSGIAGVNSGTYTAGTYGDLQLNKLNSTEINVNELISIISSGISFSNFIKFNDSSTASGPSLGSVSNGTRLLLNENNTDGHNAIGIQYAGINGTWFSVPSGGTFTFYNGTAPQLTINSTSLNYGSLTASPNGSITSASWDASTIAVNKGGTGRTSYSNGQLLIGSGTSLVANTLTAGTGISITNGSGTITINTSGLQTRLSDPVTGTGTNGKIPKWSSTSTLNDSILSEASTIINIAGSFNSTIDNTYLSFDANARRIGMTKKGGFTGKFTYGSGSSFAIAQSNSGTIEATNTFTDRLVINSIGNVGVGTDTPQSKVHITDTNNLNTIIEYTNTTAGFASGVRPLKLLLTASNGVAVGAGVGIDFVTKSSSTEYTGARIISNRTDTSSNHALTFWAGGGTTSLSEYMRISSNGNVGIGTTTPAELLTVYGDSKYLYLQAQNNSGSAGIKFGNTSARQQMYIEGTSNDLVVDSMNGVITESIRIGYNTGAVTINESGSDLDFRVEGDTDTNLVFVDASTDRVGIGTSSPGYKLQVNGSFAASTKSFRIHHPSKKDHSLEYGSLESPYHGVRLTGRGTVIKGVGMVSLPSYLKDLIHDDDTLNIQITNIKHSKTIYIDKIDLKNDQFIVKVDRAKSLGELQFFWTLSGVRKDVDHLVVEKEN